ncbi:flagellar biosynthetic protein FliQ [Fluviicoccus keumensis]|uniref:Flagellar biosynthetic protein FliQ n=1 Tax=Fluviicoccus keumensis TaxID=1435465 RepID=A0A4Q7YNE7_9GAMM|nr:flagellar biosynthetic protein FliQ [Fluviicoccus keumensis]RZU38514.1 flagellar biosynthetic protein FliQ [Fluviicoccus keumensis]
MTQDQVLHILFLTLVTAAKLAAPILLAVLIIGLLVSIFQVATQIQEMTLTFIPKLAVAVLILIVLGDWMLGTLKAFALEIIEISISR